MIINRTQMQLILADERIRQCVGITRIPRLRQLYNTGAQYMTIKPETYLIIVQTVQSYFMEMPLTLQMLGLQNAEVER